MDERTPKEKLVAAFRDLSVVVDKLNAIYEEHPHLDDQVDISRLVPMSIDDWSCAIWAFLDEQERLNNTDLNLSKGEAASRLVELAKRVGDCPDDRTAVQRMANIILDQAALHDMGLEGTRR